MKIPFQGRMVEGTPMPFQIVQDGSVVLELEDGARMRVRPVILHVVRTEEKTPEGDRLYIVQNLVTMVTERPAKGDEQ